MAMALPALQPPAESLGATAAENRNTDRNSSTADKSAACEKGAKLQKPPAPSSTGAAQTGSAHIVTRGWFGWRR